MILLTIMIIALTLGISWAVTVGIVYLVCICFGLTFSLKVATGIWLILTLLAGFFKAKSNTKE